MSRETARPQAFSARAVDHVFGASMMKLSLFFAVMDLLIVMAYPIVYIVQHLHKLKGEKR